MRVASVELAACQFDENFLDKRRDFVQHILEFINFSFLLVDIFLDFDSSFFIFRSLVENSLFFLVVFFQLFIFSSKMLIDVDQVVNFLIEDIHIGEQVVVLLLSLDESVLNFEDIGETSCLFDGVEGFINYFHVSLIVVNKFYFFFIVDYQLGESLLQDSCCIVLDCTNLSCFDSAPLVESRISEFFVEFC